MRDSILALAVVMGPTIFALVIELVDEKIRKRSRSWRAGVITFGIALSVLTWWQQTRDRAKAQADTRALKEQITQQEQVNDERFKEVTTAVNKFFAENPLRRRPTIAIPKFPTADEIASAVSDKLNQRITSKPPLENFPPIVRTAPVPVTPAENPIQKVTPCRGDRLSECSNEQLLEWAKPLIATLDTIQTGYMADLKKLDDIKGGRFNWLREIVSVGDKDSKWLREYDLAQKRATDKFKDCCAERALAYHKELLQRNAGTDSAELYQWIQILMGPPNSKEWKKARESGGGKVVDVFYDLEIMQIGLHYR